MKKILSILASFGMVATTVMTVVACTTAETNNPNVSLNTIKAWFDAAQPYTNNNNEKVEGRTMVIAIGGRHNSDTISYLATLNQLVNNNSTLNINDILKQENITELDNTLSNYNSNENNHPEWQAAMRNMIGALNSPTDPGRDPNQVSVIARNYFYHDPNILTTNMRFHTVLVDKIEEFWNGNLGKGIINDILAVQMKELLEFVVKDAGYPINQEIRDLVEGNKFNKFIEDKTKSLVDSFQNEGSSGPWFLVVRSGKIVGITSGFRNYYEFNSEYTAEDQRDNSFISTSGLTNRTFQEFSESISQSLVQGINWITDHFINTSKTIESNDVIKRNNPTSKSNPAWTSKTSGTSNIEDLDDPRKDKKEENKDNNETETPDQSLNTTYHFSFLD